MTEPTEAEKKLYYAEEVKLAHINPFILIDEGYLYIKTKAGELLKLKLNKAQQILYAKIKELREQKKPVRIWVLKFRQGGISTLTEALIYALTSQQENRNSLIMADEKDKSNYLFEMSKLYQEKLEEHQPHLAPVLKKSNEKKLEFDKIHSQILIETGQNVDAANAFTYQYVHLSETARFPRLKDVLSGLLQTVPDHWDTLVIGESTAKGIDNDFYDEWQKAKKGQSDWLPLFLGWYIMPEYSRPLGLDGELEPLEGVQYDTDGGYDDFRTEEALIQKKYQLSNEQINWRRWAIKNKCQSDVRIFRQEYPSDDNEAFLTSGECVFDKLRLKEQRECAVVKAVGTLYEEELTGKVRFRKAETGKFRVFEEIGKRDKIVMGADVSEGIGLDLSCACALNIRTNNTVMGYSGQTDPDEFAKDLALMGRYLNNALIAPENNNMGFAVCSQLNKIYSRVYKVILGKGEKKREKIGWTTTSTSRPDMIAHLTTEIREDTTELRDIELVDQCMTFVRKQNHKIEAQEGKKDCYVFARMIAGELRILYPFYSQSLEYKKGSFLGDKYGPKGKRKRGQGSYSRRTKRN